MIYKLTCQIEKIACSILAWISVWNYKLPSSLGRDCNIFIPYSVSLAENTLLFHWIKLLTFESKREFKIIIFDLPVFEAVRICFFHSKDMLKYSEWTYNHVCFLKRIKYYDKLAEGLILKLIRRGYKVYPWDTNDFSQTSCRLTQKKLLLHIRGVSFRDDWVRLLKKYPCPNNSILSLNSVDTSSLFKKLRIKKPYVCLHFRLDHNYGFNHNLGLIKGDNRNVRTVNKLDDYFKVVELLVKRGFQVVRMGDINDQPLNWSINGFIDYARSENQSVMNDFILASECFFFIGCASGPEHFAITFNKPLLTLNYILFFNSIQYFPKIRFVPKEIIDGKGRSLSIIDIMADLNIFYCHHYKHFKKLKLQLFDSRLEWMLNAVDEMIELVNNKSTDWEGYTQLQMYFKSQLRPEHGEFYKIMSVPCDSYLRVFEKQAENDGPINY